MSDRKQVGDKGENLVRDYLVSLGYTILAQKWRCLYGEVDLIVTKSEWLVFVEVKTRSVRNWDSNGLLAISAAKQQKLVLTAQTYLAQHPALAQSLRFDVALVQHDRYHYRLVDYLVHAFTVET
ncbi:MAG: YraN family protein [Pseudanabaenaceae cyanobacterium]